MVTGASNGIGLGFSKVLAQQGFNIVLVARNKERLEAAEEKVRELAPKVKTKVVIFNFNTHYNKETYKPLMEALEDLDISILVNNIGYCYIPRRVEEGDAEQVAAMLTVNTVPHTFKTLIKTPINSAQ